MKLASNGSTINSTMPVMVDVYEEDEGWGNALTKLIETITDMIESVMELQDFFEYFDSGEEDDDMYNKK